MESPLLIELPEFHNQQSLGVVGIVEQLGGSYRGRPALASRLIESAARLPAVAERFLRVARDFAALGDELRRKPPTAPHAGLCEVVFDGRDGRGEPVLIVAMPPGGNEFRSQDAGRWSEVRALHLAAQLAETLLLSHLRGLYSCSLTPSNLLIGNPFELPGMPVRPTLLSLGFTSVEAAFYETTGQRATGLTGEDMAYRAPELREDPTQVHEQAEVYSLAALLHFLIFGRLRGGTGAVKAGVNDEVRALIAEMMVELPQHRPQLRGVHQRMLAVISNLNDFELLEPIWESGECSLQRALQVSTQRTGWLRLLPARCSAPQRAQLAGVAESLRELAPPAVVPTWETGDQPDRRPYIFCAGVGEQTLRSYVEKHGPVGRAALSLVEGLARTLRGLHRHGLLYLGLCPDNVMVQAREASPGGAEQAVPLQCWLMQTEYTQGRRNPASGYPQTLVEDPTLHPPAYLATYLAPEQYGQSGAIAERSDVYALGSLLCFLLTGKAPPLGSVELAGDVGIDRLLHEVLARLVNRMRARRPADRPTADETVRTLAWLTRIDELMRGELLDDRYRIERTLALGGMNALFVVTDATLGRQAVLKCPFPDQLIAIDRTLPEAEAATRARRGSPAVVDILHYGELDPEVPYLLMEMVDGELLTDRLRRQGGRLPEAEVILLGTSIAEIMHKVHEQGVIHRDLKPDNLMLEPAPVTPGGVRVRILDFGIARLAAEQYAQRRRLTGVGSFMGTPDFVAPEQGVDASGVTDRADVYSLGVILYYLLGGPLPAAQPLQPVATAGLMQLLAQMLAMLPKVRPSMEEVALRLRELSRPPPPRIPKIFWVSIANLALGTILTVTSVGRILTPSGNRSVLCDLGIQSGAADLRPAVDLRPSVDLRAAADLRPAVDLRPIDTKPRCHTSYSKSCIHAKGLTEEQKQNLAELASAAHVRVCDGKPLRLQKLSWYVPALQTAEGKRLEDLLRASWTMKNYDLNAMPKEIKISCP